MGVMNVYAMDIVDFVTAKSKDPNKLNHFNLSVMVDDDFIAAVKEDKNVFLHFPVYDDHGHIIKDPTKWQYCKEVSAKELWDLITRQAYDTGEPGVLFYDNMNRDNNLWYKETIVATNPCGEYLAGTVWGGELPAEQYGGACNLGSLFLHRFVKNPFTNKAHVDRGLLNDTIFTAVRMLDNIIDINHFPDPIYENYQKYFRTIGLGTTGLADMLVMLGMRYDSKGAREYVDDLYEDIAYAAYIASIELAKEKGAFPGIDKEKHAESNYIQKNNWGYITDQIRLWGIRNAKLLSVAPCGTLSLAFGNNCSSGIEPIFQLEYERKVKFGGQDDKDAQVVQMMDDAYAMWCKMPSSERTVNVNRFITALDISVEDHLKMLAEISKHIDMSVSKTINIPTDYSFEDTQAVYMQAHGLGIKGCTIFRPNALRQGILISNNNKEEKPKEENTCKATATLPRGYILDTTNDCIGRKRKLVTGCGSLHCTAWFDPITGDLLEVFLDKGSSGGCERNLQAISRMISISARAGVDVHAICKQLLSVGACNSYCVRTATKHDTSKGSACSSAVGFALLDMWQEIQDELFSGDVSTDEESIESALVEKRQIHTRCPFLRWTTEILTYKV